MYANMYPVYCAAGFVFLQFKLVLNTHYQNNTQLKKNLNLDQNEKINEIEKTGALTQIEELYFFYI